MCSHWLALTHLFPLSLTTTGRMLCVSVSIPNVCIPFLKAFLMDKACGRENYAQTFTSLNSSNWTNTFSSCAGNVGCKGSSESFFYKCFLALKYILCQHLRRQHIKHGQSQMKWLCQVLQEKLGLRYLPDKTFMHYLSEAPTVCFICTSGTEVASLLSLKVLASSFLQLKFPRKDCRSLDTKWHERLQNPNSKSKFKGPHKDLTPLEINYFRPLNPATT